MRAMRVSPLSGRTLSQRNASDGDVIGSGTQVNVDTGAAPVSLLAPSVDYPTPDRAAFMVFDAGGAAEVNPITVDGNGRLIDGEATVTLERSGATFLFLLDEDADQWVTTLLPRRDATGEFPFFLASDLRALLPPVEPPKLLIDLAEIGKSGNLSWQQQFSPYTCATMFTIHRPRTLVGARLWLRGDLTRQTYDIKLTLWNANGGVRLYDETLTLPNNALSDIVFATSHALTPQISPASGWMISAIDVTGGGTTNKLGAFCGPISGFNGWSRNLLPANGTGWIQESGVFIKGMAYTNAYDSFPNTDFPNDRMMPLTPVFAPE